MSVSYNEYEDGRLSKYICEELSRRSTESEGCPDVYGTVRSPRCVRMCMEQYGVRDVSELEWNTRHFEVQMCSGRSPGPGGVRMSPGCNSLFGSTSAI
jgi:hypothetical protein